MNKVKEKIMEVVFLFTAVVSIIAVADLYISVCQRISGNAENRCNGFPFRKNMETDQ